MVVVVPVLVGCLGGWGEGGGCFLFLLFWGTPKDMDLRNAYMYSLPRHLTVQLNLTNVCPRQRLAQDLALAIES